MSSLINRKEMNTLADRWATSLLAEFDTLFNDTFYSPITCTSKSCYPRVNIKETKDCVQIEAAIPGLTKEDVSVEYRNGTLIIQGGSQNEKEDSNNGYIVRELHKSAFSRRFNVDEKKFDPEKIEAGVDNGVLSVTIGKREQETIQSTKIEVK